MKLHSYRCLFQINQLLIGQCGKFAAQEHEGNNFLHEELFNPFYKIPNHVETYWNYLMLQHFTECFKGTDYWFTIHHKKNLIFSLIIFAAFAVSLLTEHKQHEICVFTIDKILEILGYLQQ